MDVTVQVFLMLFGLAFVCEFVDSSLGMGYGTILSPVLLIMGFDPLLVVPAVLLSQAFGGFSASMFHQQFENASFKAGSRDLKVVLVISGFGIAATIFAAVVALNVPRIWMKTYIGVLVTVMGVVLLSKRRFAFSWRRMMGLGVLSAFNKGLSGGGFGPVVTGGQIISGQDHKGAIAATTLAEAPICLVGFATYMVGHALRGWDGGSVLAMPMRDFLRRMFAADSFQWELVLALLLGAVFVAPFGAFTTKVLPTERLSRVLGVLVTGLGLWALWQTFF